MPVNERRNQRREKNIEALYIKPGQDDREEGDAWQSVNLDHPATFDTLAMEIEEKRMIMEDLERFVKRKEFYRKVGKAWKRGYFAVWATRDWKSSLIAAMANFLKFDIYDLELTDLRTNSELRKVVDFDWE
ncbi:hypothetical protein GH714_031729 [Hevea brasiliensis]|uniref:Uncharacterized protein n=1 Tax=Hevea brasiliensis TaxID=3981 RepID=A0A6A6NB77_HEVBR|nr:hypothetical protein GH714_031729 [Hevea brasiliensis]